MSKLVLVKNLKFNNNEPFKASIPLVYCYDSIIKPYMRAYMFNNVEFTFDVEEIEKSYGDLDFTDLFVDFEYDVNIIDNSSSLEKVEYTVTVFHQASIVMWIDDDIIHCKPDNLEQAAFEVMLSKLPLSFMFR